MYRPARARICKPFKESGTDSLPGRPVRQPYLLHQLARLQQHRLAESIPRNRFLGIVSLESIPKLLKRLLIRAQATLACRIGSLESFLGLFKRLKIRAQATLASDIGSLELIPGLLKRLQIRAQATLANGIGSMESIPGLLKCLQIRAQATLASGIGSLESIPGLHNMKNKDEDVFFFKTNIFVPQYQRDKE